MRSIEFVGDMDQEHFAAQFLRKTHEFIEGGVSAPLIALMDDYIAGRKEINMIGVENRVGRETQAPRAAANPEPKAGKEMAGSANLDCESGARGLIPFLDFTDVEVIRELL